MSRYFYRRGTAPPRRTGGTVSADDTDDTDDVDPDGTDPWWMDDD